MHLALGPMQENADITIALAVDYTTAGEKLTHKASGEKYLKLDVFDTNCLDCSRLLWKRLQKVDSSVINVAGNGIYTLTKHGYNQKLVNHMVHTILELVHKHHPISKIISGGQTGVDIAGGWAAVKLGIPCRLTLPKGFLQRHEDGKDVCHAREEILAQITSS